MINKQNIEEIDEIFQQVSWEGEQNLTKLVQDFKIERLSLTENNEMKVDQKALRNLEKNHFYSKRVI